MSESRSESSGKTTVGLVRTEDVPDGAAVVHFDELCEDAQRWVLEHTVSGSVEQRDHLTAYGLSEGDVIVFTDYLELRAI